MLISRGVFVEKILFVFSLIGTWFVYLIGGWQLLLTILVVFMCIDITTGIIKALIQKRLNSKIGLQRVLKKSHHYVSYYSSKLVRYIDNI
ncbi:MAG: phage holin family protein [Paenisporosarcina sp.]